MLKTFLELNTIKVKTPSSLAFSGVPLPSSAGGSSNVFLNMKDFRFTRKIESKIVCPISIINTFGKKKQLKCIPT